MLKVEDFKELSKAPGKRNKILAVENQLKAYNEACAIKAWNMNFAETVREAQKLRQACLDYRVARPKSKRFKGVDKILEMLDVEEPAMEKVDKASKAEGAVMAKFLMDAREGVFNGILRLTQKEASTIDMWVNGCISYVYNSKCGMLGKGNVWSSEAQDMVIDDMEVLQEMSGREAVPSLIRAILKQILSARIVGQISPGMNGVNAKYNETRGSTTKYTLNHCVLVDGGRRFRLGSLVHELTHICVAEAFGNSVLMLSMPRGSSDDEYLAVSRSRTSNLAALAKLVETDDEINSPIHSRSGLKSALATQCGYGMSKKLATNYVPNLTLRLNKEEGEEFVPWIMGLAEKGMGAEIIEYDSVVNQMLVWCSMNNLPATNPIYKSLESMASDERDRRASGLASPPLRTPIEKPVKIETVQNNLPKLQGVKAVGSPKMVSGPKPVH